MLSVCLTVCPHCSATLGRSAVDAPTLPGDAVNVVVNHTVLNEVLIVPSESYELYTVRSSCRGRCGSVEQQASFVVKDLTDTGGDFSPPLTSHI